MGAEERFRKAARTGSAAAGIAGGQTETALSGVRHGADGPSRRPHATRPGGRTPRASRDGLRKQRARYSTSKPASSSSCAFFTSSSETTCPSKRWIVRSATCA